MSLRRFSLVVLILMSLVLPAGAQDTHFYQKGKKVPLKVKASKKYVLLKPQTTPEAVSRSLQDSGAVMRRFAEAKPLTGINVENRKAPPPRWAIIDQISVDASPLKDPSIADDILYEAPFFVTPSGAEVGLSHLFYVKLKDASDRDTLQRLAEEHKVTILGQNKFMPLWFTLACSKESSGNALAVANKFFESGEFSVAEPDFLVEYQLQCADDEYFDEQWGLENTGQHGGTVGVDINACDAWNFTTGSDDVVVAVLDHGIDLTHPDMPNISLSSYDTGTGTSPSVVRGNHGTACAGIIGAARNNENLGVAGVAPDTTLMSISNSLMLGPNTQQQLADGLNWAWQNGADVISNSWGHKALASALIDDAIETALSDGRDGLGTIVVFAAGNADGAVIYPANSNPDILVVGAMSPCAQRKNPLSCDGETWWGSCYGDEVDVVAPGVLIPTTDRQGSVGYDSGDYVMDFNGTSSACPHVAGVAALVLAVNPDLTGSQVVQIIEQNAQKVGSYDYETTTDRPHGTWHKEMGYGLVDAAACVAAAEAVLPPELVARSRLATSQLTATAARVATSVAAESGDTATRSSQRQSLAPSITLRSASWLLSYNWEHGGSGTTVITFHSNGTFTTGQGGSGRWVQRSGDARAFFAFSRGSSPDWSVVYSLTVASDGSSFSGVQGWSHTSGRPQKGTHTAVRTVFTQDPSTLAATIAPPSQVAADGSEMTD
jgi:subtilisin family serine protease